jgi:hypothetical protein
MSLRRRELSALALDNSRVASRRLRSSADNNLSFSVCSFMRLILSTGLESNVPNIAGNLNLRSADINQLTLPFLMT